MNNYINQCFLKHWSHKTSYSDDWSAKFPSKGQCAISSLMVHELLGGDIARIQLSPRNSHYFNVIDGNIYDITSDQFETKLNYEKYKIIDSSELLSNINTAHRYKTFSESVMPEIESLLPVEQIEHISIRDPNYVAGTAEKPEVKVFCQTNKKSRPLNKNKLSPLQNVYMKWVGGPIVARSKIVSWHSGQFNGGIINKLRELTIGTNLFGLSEYWKSVSEKENGFYAVTHLSDEQWLDKLLYPSAKSYGSSWVYLDTVKKKIQWLSLNHEPTKERKKGRNIPASMRFLVLKRDNYTCQYCGRSAPDVPLHIDHKIPWSKVKEHKIENLVVACRDCNLGKSDKEL